MVEWHIHKEGQTTGPFSEDQLKAFVETNAISAATLVWKDGLAGWAPLSQTDLAHLLPSMPPPPPAIAANPASSLSMWAYFKRAMTSRYATFSGRATRKEYWSFCLFGTLIAFLALAILSIFIHFMTLDVSATNKQLAHQPIVPQVATLFFLATLCPSFALFVRRLHDFGLSAWVLLILLVPFVGGVASIVIGLIPSEIKDNAYGPYPAN